MAVTAKQTLSLYSTPGNIPPPVRKVKIAASQGIWMPGAPFFINSTTGTAKISDSTDGTGDAYHCFLIETITAELAVDTEVAAVFIDQSYIYQAYIDSGLTDTAESQVQVGDQVGLSVKAGTAGEIGYTTIDVGDTTNVAVMVVDIMSNVDPEKYDTSTAPGVALVKFLPAVINATRAS